MAEVVFGDPLGSAFEVIELASILRLIEEKQQKYWNSRSGAGHASLSYYGNGRSPEAYPDARLVFTMRNGQGYHIYYDKQSDHDYYAHNGRAFTKAVKINYAGTSKSIPTALFVNREQAISVLKTFFRTGGRSRKVSWVKSDCVPWREFQS